MSKKALTKEFGGVVKRTRKRLKLTQTELGAYAETGLNFISQLERGKASVRLDKALSVLNVLGLELELRRGKGGLTLAKDL